MDLILTIHLCNVTQYPDNEIYPPIQLNYCSTVLNSESRFSESSVLNKIWFSRSVRTPRTTGGPDWRRPLGIDLLRILPSMAKNIKATLKILTT